MNHFTLNKQVAIVTGASRGIGRATAITLASLGARVVLNSTSLFNLVSVKDEIERNGGQAIPCVGSIGSLEDIRKIIQSVQDSYGRIDILVNNAGIGGVGKLIQDLSYEEWNDMIHHDLTSVFMFCKEVLPYMMRQGRGKIINISSVSGIMGVSGSVPYSAAKAGVIGLTKALAREAASFRINVNTVAPGLIDTVMSRARGTEESGKLVLWPRIGVPQDVAGLVAFLASDAAEFITGQVISPNGGGLI